MPKSLFRQYGRGFLTWRAPDGEGIPLAILPAALPLRFIPTRVGNTTASMAARAVPSVHPHACGEYSQALMPGSTVTGSSPRVWGILRAWAWSIRHVRFIPTRVGNTSIILFIRFSISVHPHACGEYGAKRVELDAPAGSSPRVWGIRFGWLRRTDERRFIPTRVGNTF